MRALPAAVALLVLLVVVPWGDGQFVLELRYAEGKTERMAEFARELAALKPDVIVTATDIAISAVPPTWTGS